MNFFIILACLLFAFFITNIVYEYIHTFNPRKRRYKKNTSDNKRLLRLFIHFHILSEIVFTALLNLIIKFKILYACLKKFLLFKTRLLIYPHGFKKKNELYNEEVYKNVNKNIFEPQDNEIYEEQKNYERFRMKLNKTNEKIQVKTIYFIRHSESVWNSVINKKLTGKTFFNLILVLFYEMIFLFSRKTVMVDSPLSNTGIIQSIELGNFLKGDMNNNATTVTGANSYNNNNNNTNTKLRNISMYEKQNDNNSNTKKHHGQITTEYINVNELKYNTVKTENSTNRFGDTTSDISNDNIDNSKENNETMINYNEMSSINRKRDNELQNKSYDKVIKKENYKKKIDSIKKNNKQNKNSDNSINNNCENEDIHKDIINMDIQEHINVLNNKKYKSVILSSNLRRTISSCFIAFYNRINKHNETIHVLNSLEEISRNPDCLSLFPYYNNTYVATDIETFIHKDIDKLINNNIKIENNYINNKFIDTLSYIFNNDNDIFIIFGHSLWFQFFFNYYLKQRHIAKTNKIKNSGIVVFNMRKYSYDDKEKYEIEKDSVRALYKGFENEQMYES
ncbi:conserved protein, unknown function [Hepatocystis sp. ex Piliocolobus tephrosceles]|nr:conserved protein, unknown function [Hepatocystis sp. ex Piliocolobus tephrosceles]